MSVKQFVYECPYCRGQMQTEKSVHDYQTQCLYCDRQITLSDALLVFVDAASPTALIMTELEKNIKKTKIALQILIGLVAVILLFTIMMLSWRFF